LPKDKKRTEKRAPVTREQAPRINIGPRATRGRGKGAVEGKLISGNKEERGKGSHNNN